MRHWINILLLVLSSNMDDFSFGFALGFKEKVKWWVAAIIGLMSGVTMGAGMIIGNFADLLFTTEIEKGISVSIYLILAIVFAIDELQNNSSEQKETNTKKWTPLSAFIVGIALGIDSFFLGISAGLLNYPLWITSALAGISSFLLIFSGTVIARRIAAALPKTPRGSISAGLLLLMAVMTLV